MEIVPCRGIDSTTLGDTRSETREILGNPDQAKDTIEQSGINTIVWTYRLMRLELNFHELHAFKLSKIISRHPNTLVLGFNPIGLNERYLLQKFPSLREIESHDHLQVFFDDSLKLSFTLVREKTESVTIHPETSENAEEVIWPIRN